MSSVNSCCYTYSKTILIGYKLRSQVGKHLEARSKAVSSAVGKLNAAAKALDPPRPTISAAEILDKTFLSEFDLLRDSRNQIRDKPWAIPSVRIIIDQYFRLVRAKEEVIRLNIEMRRTRTWIRDEEAAMKSTLEHLRTDDADLAYQVQIRLRARSLVHIRILKQFKEVEGFIGFTGIKTCGVSRELAAVPVVTPPATIAEPPQQVEPGEEEDDGVLSDHSLDEAEQDEMDRMDNALTRGRRD